MAGDVLIMKDLTINKHWCSLKDICFKNRHKPYANRWQPLKYTQVL